MVWGTEELFSTNLSSEPFANLTDSLKIGTWGSESEAPTIFPSCNLYVVDRVSFAIINWVVPPLVDSIRHRARTISHSSTSTDRIGDESPTVIDLFAIRRSVTTRFQLSSPPSAIKQRWTTIRAVEVGSREQPVSVSSVRANIERDFGRWYRIELFTSIFRLGFTATTGRLIHYDSRFATTQYPGRVKQLILCSP